MDSEIVARGKGVGNYDVVDDGALGLEHIAQPQLGRVFARLSSPVLIHRQAISLFADGELPQVIVEPADRYLDDVVQDLEGDRGGDLDLMPDQRIGVLELDAKGGDLVQAFGCGRYPGSYGGNWVMTV